MTSPQGTRAPQGRRRRGIAALLSVLCFALLSACGARVDTVFTLDDGPSGSRVMTLTLPRSDLDQYVAGGVEALEASIRTHKPAELDYSGLTVTEESATASFTLAFDTAETYREKVEAVLAAGAVEGVPTIGLSTQDSLFLRGGAVEEDFTSNDLLAWLVDGLVADGTVTQDRRGDVLESGKTQVVYRGESASASQPISFAKMTDNGVTSVGLTTWLLQDGTFERVVELRMPATAYDSDPEAFDAYFREATPQQGTLVAAEPEGGSVGWSIRFAARDAVQVAAMTDQVLGSSSTTFTVTERPSADNPVRRRTAVVDVVDCDAICSPRADPVRSTIVIPAGWELVGSSADATSTTDADGLQVTHRPTSTPVELDHAIPFDAIHVSTRIAFDRSVEQTITFDVADRDVDAAGDGFERLLTVEGLPAPVVTTADGMTSYTLTLSADGVDELNAQLGALSPVAFVEVAPAAGDGFWWARYRVTVGLGLTSGIADGGVRRPVTYDTHVPFGFSISQQDSTLGVSGSVDGRTATAVGEGGGDPTSSVAVSGPTVGLLVVLVVLGLGALVTAIGLVVFRDRVTQLVDAAVARRDRRAAQRAAVLAAAAVVVHAPAAEGPGAPAPRPVALTAGAVAVPHRAVGAADGFSEADLV